MGRLRWAVTGGVSVVARATGLARSTIHVGVRDVQASRRQRVSAAARIRRAGAGRRPLTTSDPALLTALLALIEPTTRGDPESPLRWTCKSTTQLADALTQQRHPVSPRTVATLLKGAGYSLQANRKTREGTAQWTYELTHENGGTRVKITEDGEVSSCSASCRAISLAIPARWIVI